MMWCVASRNRPQQCQKLLDNMVARGMKGRGVVGVDADEPQANEYAALRFPEGWGLMVVENPNPGSCAILRRMFDQYPDEDWYGSIADDSSVETDGFEEKLIEAAGEWGIASGNDQWQANEDVSKGRMHGAVVFGGRFVRTLGYWVPDGFQHLYVDDVWETLGRSIGNWRTLMDVVTPHNHPWKTGEGLDETTANANSPETNEHDRRAYQEWREKNAPNDVLKVLRARHPDKVFRLGPPPPLDDGLWLYLWNGDERLLVRFFRALQEQGFCTRGVIIAPKGKPLPECPWIPDTWMKSLPEKMNEPAWVGILWPDCAPQRNNWDRHMLQEIRPWGVITSAEADSGGWGAAAIMIGSAALKALGGLNTEAITPQLIANWQAAARKAKCERIRGDAQIPREGKPVQLPEPGPEVENLTLVLQRTMADFGVKVIDPDYSGVRLQIGTPSISGRPEFIYHQSIRALENMLVDKGAYCEQRFDLYNADIGLSRAKIVSEFLESSCTHLLMIDDDMGWDISAVHRLFHADKEFVAVAGPKKSYPLRFAV
ncbi:MAG: hypothetical protein KGL39_29435, partial [Patescibacteria group bacterium]|nr:hypothetical protein [Patescibacteria group bacterium]